MENLFSRILPVRTRQVFDESKHATVSEEVGPVNGQEVVVRCTTDMVVHNPLEAEQRRRTGNLKFWLALTALAFTWTSAQAPLYLFAGAPVYIYRGLGGVDYWVWFVSANLLATAAISPFVGALSDLMGRRHVAILGNLAIILGQVICGAAKDMDMFIGINELTALAGTAELVSLSHRGYYIAGMVLTVLPFLPSAMYAQLISSSATWRYIAVVTGAWAAAGLFTTVLFYHPPLPPRSARLETWSEKLGLLKRKDFVGGFLSIGGLAGFEAGILLGGYQYPWTSPRTLFPLTFGGLCLIFFVAWELWGTAHPMVPRNLSKAPGTLAMTMIITFISGANFFSVLLLWPPEAYNVYGHDPIGVGIRGLPFAFGVFTSCLVSLILLSLLRDGKVKWLIVSASVLMTAGCGSLSLARVDNIHQVYGILFVAGLGVGGITIPVSTVATIVCEPEVIATVTALTIAVRIVGGAVGYAVGYAVYFNVFVHRLLPELSKHVGAACAGVGIVDPKVVHEAVGLTAHSLVAELRHLPGIEGNETVWEQIVAAGQQGYASAYPWVYYCSVAFGGVAVIASLFLRDISDLVDDTVVAVM
ncbi:hypothetical protein VTJ49DRAFT_6851 [Mycothermus thermophilus]|uniref:Major facilitator superfamily (MFS) profile domain-containing protein n=1 Tax=Humicola insolens TaxID=85995 RepID=A0ABR3VPR2_HUMIN